jgi:hypothetical protein
LSVPLHIHDLSVGGCLIEAHYEVSIGRRIKLQIELPYEGWITVYAETLYLRENYGFAVKFVDMDDEVRGRLERVIDRLLSPSPFDE